MTVADFYDALAPWYHAIFPDWTASIGRQGEALQRLIAEHWGSGSKRLVDVAAGIGTQALALAQYGHHVIAGDLSARAIGRARAEAEYREQRLLVYRGDMRAPPIRACAVDLVLACDNSVPHLLSERTIESALVEFFRCVRAGGGCLLSLRDYPEHPPPAGTREVRPYGEREIAGRRYNLRQIWEWDGPCYDLTLEIQALDAREPVMSARTRYFAVPVRRVAQLMSAAGFVEVHRVDDAYYQPVLVGSRLAA